MGKHLFKYLNMAMDKPFPNIKTRKLKIKSDDKIIIVDIGKAVSLKKFAREKERIINLLEELKKRAKEKDVEIWQEIKYKFEQTDKNHITKEQVKKIKSIKEFEELPIFFYDDEDFK